MRRPTFDAALLSTENDRLEELVSLILIITLLNLSYKIIGLNSFACTNGRVTRGTSGHFGGMMMSTKEVGRKGDLSVAHLRLV